MLVIDPEECIDCRLCIPECPVDAIYPEEDVPADQQRFVEINERLAQKWPVIDEKKDPPEDAEQWDDIRDKIAHLAEDWS